MRYCELVCSHVLDFLLYLSSHFWGISSVGLERYLDRVEVTGSNPVCLTKQKEKQSESEASLFVLLRSRVVCRAWGGSRVLVLEFGGALDHVNNLVCLAILDWTLLVLFYFGSALHKCFWGAPVVNSPNANRTPLH
jgi:hypothetical protein